MVPLTTINNILIFIGYTYIMFRNNGSEHIINTEVEYMDGLNKPDWYYSGLAIIKKLTQIFKVNLIISYKIKGESGTPRQEKYSNFRLDYNNVVIYDSFTDLWNTSCCVEIKLK